MYIRIQTNIPFSCLRLKVIEFLYVTNQHHIRIVMLILSACQLKKDDQDQVYF